MNLGDLTFQDKTKSQLEETKEINGMARLLFPIFLECHFIPDSYVILLAVLMNTMENVELMATSIFLNHGWFIDLLMNTGLATLKPAISNEPIPQPEPEMNPN